MISDLASVVTKIGAFLGGDAAAIAQEPDGLAEIVTDCRFDSMKQTPAVWFPQEHMYENRRILPYAQAEFRYKLEFLRKGTTRDWISLMTKRQSDLIDGHHRVMMAGTVAEGWCHAEMAYPQV